MIQSFKFTIHFINFFIIFISLLFGSSSSKSVLEFLLYSCFSNIVRRINYLGINSNDTHSTTTILTVVKI